VKELTFISEKLNRYDAILSEKHRKRNSWSNTQLPYFQMENPIPNAP
jgi:hypothetical protein